MKSKKHQPAVTEPNGKAQSASPLIRERWRMLYAGINLKEAAQTQFNMKNQRSSTVSHPFTFHIQVLNTFVAQIEVEEFRNFFSDQQVRAALDTFGKIHFARTVLIPMNRTTATAEGTFAFQVMMVYDGEWEELARFFWDCQPLRNLFQRASGIAINPGDNVAAFNGFEEFIRLNNITRTSRELHKGYTLSVKEIRQAFSR